jgi:RNA polymerase sigma-70 factor (ECF subfamily)
MAFAQLADEDLMQLVRRGDAAAFEAVYDRHATAAFSLAYRMTGTRNTAEDVVQEAFLSLWRSGARYDRTRGSVRTWVLGIVHNRAIDALRRSMVHDRRRASDEGIEERFEARERTDVEAARRDEARDVRQALGTLPAEQCKVIELAYFGGFTHSEIASMLDTPIGTGQGPHAPGPREAARPAGRPGGGDDMSACDRRDDVGSYVLRALPDDEHERFEAHLATCADCRRDGRRAAGRGRHAAARRRCRSTRPRAARAHHDHRALRGRAALGRRRACRRARRAPAAKAPRRRRRWSLSLRPLPAAMAASALIAAGVIGGIVLTGGDDTKTVTGTVQIASAPAARASLELSDDATKLEVRRMPPPPAGKVYQVWLKRPNQDPAPTTALFRTDPSGSADVQIQRGRLKGVDQVLVTAEPDGGSMKPTSTPVIVASTA